MQMDNYRTYKKAQQDKNDAIARMHDIKHALTIDIQRVFSAYCDRKDEVSTRHWKSLKVRDFKIKGSCITVFSGISYPGYTTQYRWKFPASWLELSDTELSHEVRQMIYQESIRFDQKKRDREEELRRVEMERLRQLEEKYYA